MKRNRAKTLFNKAEKLWKEICYKRDGKQCQVQKHFPYINISHTKVFQVDHCITRRCSWTFFMIENATVVCSACNQAKGFNSKSVSRAIDEIVIKREGQDVFDEMVAIDRSKKPNRDWKSVWYLENIIKILEKQKELYEVL